MKPVITPGKAYSFMAFICLSMLGYALYAQYVQKFEPCPICYFQRLLIGLLGLVWLTNAFIKSLPRLQLTLQLMVCLGGAALALRHFWIQTHPEIAGSCGMGIQYMLDSYPFLDVVLKSWKGTADCTDASWKILGLTAPVWLTAFFAAGAAASVFCYRFARRGLNPSV